MFLNDCFFFALRIFPASGARERYNGSFVLIGQVGHSWCSSSGGQASLDAGFLRFTADEAKPFYLGSRSYAIQVRCVQAFIDNTFSSIVPVSLAFTL